MTGHLLLALGLTLGLLGGVLGLGRLLGVRDTPAAAVAGLHMLWWPAALAGALVAPAAGAWLVLGGAVAGVGVLAVRRFSGRTLAAVAGFTAAGAPVWLAPPVFYDALVYHLGMPWSWLVNGSMAPVPHNLFSHFPLAASVVFLGPVRLGLPEAAAGLHWACLGLAAAAAAGLARRLGAGRYAWTAGLCTAASWHALWIAGVAAVDQVVVLAVAVAAAEMAASLAGEEGKAWTAGLALGLALAVKYTAAVPVVALLLALVVVRPRRWRWAVGAGMVAAGSSSFWYLRNLITTGNPVYPLFWGLLGGRGWTAADDARYLATVREGVGGWSSVLDGLLQLVSPGRGLGWWLAVALLLAAAASWRRRREPGVRWLALAVALMAAGWLATSHTTRYALVLGPLVGALGALGLEGLGRPARRVAVVGLLLAAAAGWVRWGAFTFGELGWMRWLPGPAAAEDWRHRVTVNDPLPAYRAADRVLPPSATLLIVAEGRSWGCPRPHHASSAYDTQLAQEVVEDSSSAGEAATRLKALGFSHMLVNLGELGRLGGPPFRVLDWHAPAAAARWRRLLAVSRPVWRGRLLELRELP